MPQEILRAAQLLVGLPRHGELHLVTLGCEWDDHRPRWLRNGTRSWRLRRSAGGDRQSVLRFRLGKPAHPRCYVRLRAHTRDEVLDIPLALAARGPEQFAVVLGRQMRGQKPYCGQVHRPTGQQFQNFRKASRSPSRLNPAVRGVFR